MNKPKDLNFIFFGTDGFSTVVLDQLEQAGYLPQSVVTAPDRPANRGQKMTKPAVKIWAEQRNISVIQPEKLNADEIPTSDLFIVASYGKIIPAEVLEIPKFKTLNVHPSLLPKYRGASPIESAILDDQKQTGVTIMQMDEKMDHGPIVEQELVTFDEWSARAEVEEKLAALGGKMLAQVLPAWIAGEISVQEQLHDEATYTSKITKDAGLLPIIEMQKLVSQELDQSTQRQIFLKVQALNPWPGVFFFIKHNNSDLRVKITEAKWQNNQLQIQTVIPAGRKPMPWQSFLDGFRKDLAL